MERERLTGSSNEDLSSLRLSVGDQSSNLVERGLVAVETKELRRRREGREGDASVSFDFLELSSDPSRSRTEPDYSHDRSQEVGPILAASNLDPVDLLLHNLSPSSVPKALRDVNPSQSRALLSRVLESRSNALKNSLPDVGRLVDQVEVLSSGLSDDSRVGSVEVNVLRDLLPESLEDGGGSGEVQTREGLVVDALLDDLGSGSLRPRRRGGGGGERGR